MGIKGDFEVRVRKDICRHDHFCDYIKVSVALELDFGKVLGCDFKNEKQLENPCKMVMF